MASPCALVLAAALLARPPQAAGAPISDLVVVGASVEPAASSNFTSWPTPFSDLGCPTAVLGGSNWIWRPGSGRWPSCDMDVRGDIATMCADAAGVPDPTSIYVNMEAIGDTTGCFAWMVSDCPVDMRMVSKIEFDIDVEACQDVWAAPFWAAPTPWLAPGGTSGEVDIVENCPVGAIASNFAGCIGAPEGLCHQQAWASSTGLLGPKRVIMTLEDSGNVQAGGKLQVTVCEASGNGCFGTGYYNNYLSSVVATKGRPAGQTSLFHLVSDIWNGHGGDGGWNGCQAKNSPRSHCKYALRNLRVHSNSGAPLFEGTCAALNPTSNVITV